MEIDPAFVQALDGMTTGSEVILLTWLHQGDRATLRVHPRDDPRNPLKGVTPVVDIKPVLVGVVEA